MVIVILLAVIIVLLLVSYQQHKKIYFSNKIRIGYEKKCNAFRIKYTILSKLEDSNEIRRKVKQLGYPIYIYGGGVHGERLLRILEKDEDIEILRVLESNELKNQIGQVGILNQDAKVIITPMFDYDSIVNLLMNFTSKENIIGIDEFL